MTQSSSPKILHPIVHYSSTLLMVRAFFSGGIFRDASRLPFVRSDFPSGTLITLKPTFHNCPRDCSETTITCP